MSCSIEFITDEILLCFELFGMESDKDADRELIFLMSCLMVSIVHMLDADEVTQVIRAEVEGNEQLGCLSAHSSYILGINHTTAIHVVGIGHKTIMHVLEQKGTTGKGQNHNALAGTTIHKATAWMASSSSAFCQAKPKPS